MEASSTSQAQRPPAFDGDSHRASSVGSDLARTFSLEALAPCLADLKRQLALRQAMA